eukprot:PITA_07311
MQGFKEGRKGRCYSCSGFNHYARECPHKKNSPRDDDNNNNNNSKGNGNQRNNRFNNKGKRSAPTARNGNGQPPKRIRNTRYDESNVVEKQNEFYLISTLSTAYPLDTLDHWLIDSGPSRHFTGYKEDLSNFVEKKTNLEIILGDNATYPVKGIGIVTLHLNQGQTIHVQEVLYVPDLKKNLVSISVMEDKGFKVPCIDGKVRIWRTNPKYAFTLGFRVDGLYQIGEVLWELWQAILLFNLSYGIGGSPTYITKPYLREVGIRMETIVPYTPEQNGIAKRKNQTIMEATHAMLHDQNLPKFLWEEVVNTVVYVQNRSPHQALDFKTPKEVFTGKKPDVSHFRIFGCLVYFHVSKEKRNKLKAFGKNGIFVGYSENSKAYRIYMPGQRDVEVNRDVTFDEDIALGKARDFPIPRKGDDDAMEKQDEPPTDEPMLDVDGPMDPTDPPPGHPSTSRKRPLWLKDTLEDAERHTTPRGTFHESKMSNRYQGYLAAMSTIIQAKPCTFEEAVKHYGKMP